MALHRLGREGVGGSGQGAERPRCDPLLSLLGYHLGRAIELLGFQKVAHGSLPIPAAQKEIGYLGMFGQHPARPTSESSLRRKKSRKSGCKRYSSPLPSVASVMNTLRPTSDGKIVEQPESG